MKVNLNDCLKLESFRNAKVLAGADMLDKRVKSVSVFDEADLGMGVERNGARDQMVLTHFWTCCGDDAVHADQELTVKIEALSDHNLPVMLTEDEQVRRYKEMSAIYGQDFAFPSKYTLVLNRLCPTVRALAAMEDQDTAKLLCRQLFDLARLSGRPLEAGDLKDFITRSNELVAKLAEKA